MLVLDSKFLENKKFPFVQLFSPKTFTEIVLCLPRYRDKALLSMYVFGFKQKPNKEVHTDLFNLTLRTKGRKEKEIQKVEFIY